MALVVTLAVNRIRLVFVISVFITIIGLEISGQPSAYSLARMTSKDFFDTFYFTVSEATRVFHIQLLWLFPVEVHLAKKNTKKYERILKIR